MRRSSWLVPMFVFGALCLSLLNGDVVRGASNPAALIPEVSYLQGRVYAGMVGDQSQPLEGVSVELWASNNPYPDTGTFVDSTATNVDGWYQLVVPDTPVYEFYKIRQVNLAGYASVGATSVDGIVHSADWIEFVYPLGGQDLTGNKFWDMPPSEDFMLQGRVYDGQVGDESVPLGGTMVELWGSYNPYPNSGEILITTTTTVEGWYGLTLPPETVYEYYHIRSVNLPGYESIGATSVDGTVRTADWIEYAYPLDGLTLTGNKFWDRVTSTAQGPDLQVSGVWAEGGSICYQGWNAGDQEAPAGHTTELFIDSFSVDTHFVDLPVPAGGSWSACFEFSWSCSLETDLISVLTDSGNVIEESDEENNLWEQSWTCDTTPPQIVAGPDVIDIGSDYALIAWETDEESDARVLYGDLAGEYPYEAGDAGFSNAHEVYLDGLLPAHTYSYIVESRDASGNLGASRTRYFRTLALPDGQDPTITLEAQSLLFETAAITATVQDNIGVDRVVFIIDGQEVFVDYSEPFSYAFDSNVYTNGEHTVSAQAFDLAGHQGDDSLPINVANLNDASAPNVSITSPTQNSTVSGITDVKASISDDTGIVSARFYVDGDYRQFEPFDVNNPPKNATVTFSWDTRGEANGSYRLAVQAYDLDGKETTATVDVVVNNVAPAPPPSPSWLEVVDQMVLRNQNKFVVLLSVKNTGDAAARNIKIFHGMQGFQPIETQTPVATITTEANPNASYTYADIRPKTEIAPGETRAFTYNVVPLLTSPNPSTPSIGYFIDLYWDSASQTGYHNFVQAPVAKTFNGLTIPQAHAAALKTVDYLIVTNPYRLFALYNPTYSQGASTQRKQVNQLLSSMAELAFYKKGALGYNTTYNSESLRDLIKVGGNWSSKFVPGWTSNGYLLIVGETDIVSAWWRYYGTQYTTRGDLDFITSFTDYPYASTFGEEIRPELNIARLIGNNAYYLRLPILTSLKLFQGETGYSYDGLLKLAANGFPKCMSGGCDEIYFKKEVDNVVKVLPGPIVGLKTPDLAVYDLQGKIDITATEAAIYNTFFANTPNQDVVFLAGHGNGGSWDTITVGDVHSQALPFGNANPLVFASSCSTASYPSGTSLAEAFLNRRAGAYLGAINVGACYKNHVCPHADTFFSQWKNTKPISQALRDTKNKIGSGFHDRYWAGIYNLFGDAKFGGSETSGVTQAQTRSAQEAPRNGPIGPVLVEIPAVEINSTAAYDSARIPGGQLTMEVGQPAVPFYPLVFEYPSGTQIQDVSMTWRSDPEIYPGLNLLTTTLALAGEVQLLPGSTVLETATWPEIDYEWQVFENPLTTTLMLSVYPFQYDRTAQTGTFYPQYEFNIQAVESQVEISSLETDRSIYMPGEAVNINLAITSAAEAPFDGVVRATIYEAASGENVAGLPVHTLSKLTGYAGFSDVWDSGESPQGDYSVRVDVLDENGVLLDTAVDSFQVGYRSIEPVSLSASEKRINPGDMLTIDMQFENTGTAPITGTVILEVHSLQSGLLERFEIPTPEIQPGEVLPVGSTWDSGDAPSGMLEIIGYVKYAGRSSDVFSTDTVISHQLYLPQIEN